MTEAGDAVSITFFRVNCDALLLLFDRRKIQLDASFVIEDKALLPFGCLILKRESVEKS